MKWTKEANGQLEKEWNAQNPDFQFNDAEFGRKIGTTASAVAKQRSNIGLVNHKVPYHTRKPKVDVPKAECAGYVLHYNRDGQEHFMSIREGDSLAAQSTGRKVMYQLGLRELTVLQPIRKMVMQGITEIDLTK